LSPYFNSCLTRVLAAKHLPCSIPTHIHITPSPASSLKHIPTSFIPLPAKPTYVHVIGVAISWINASKIQILAIRYSQDGDTGRAIILNTAKVESLKHRKLELRDENHKSTNLRILGLLGAFPNGITHVCSYSQSLDQFVSP